MNAKKNVDDHDRLSEKDFDIQLFDEYQDLVEEMPFYDDPVLGLAGEVGEVIELIKKDRRKGDRRKPLDKEDLKLELGDVLWHVAKTASTEGLELRDIATANIDKLTKRHAR